MTLVLADTGAAKILQRAFNGSFPAGGADLTLKLFTNDIIPSDEHTAANYNEAQGGDYAAKALAAGNWTVGDIDGVQVAGYGQQVWAFTGPLTGDPTIYGYYVVDADGTLWHAERLESPFTPTPDGDVLRVTPRLGASKGTPT